MTPKISIQEESFGVIHALSLSLMHLTSSVKETGEFKDICLKRIRYSFISLLTPEMSAVRLNSRIPLV